MKILVTGGAGFIGSAVLHELLGATSGEVVNVDALTYAGSRASLKAFDGNSRYVFENSDIRDRSRIDEILAAHRPDVILHLAAESHVDRSIDGPRAFVETNILGTYELLEAARAYWSELEPSRQKAFRFLHVSTDEVFGDLAPDAPPFDAATPYAPSSPYAASKASSDHLARAWQRTYGLPVIVTNCSNNFGPRQFPEKLIPHMIISALEGRPLPVYGDGRQIRDWLFVEDHARALRAVLESGTPGETYLVGGDTEIANIDVVRSLCRLLDEMAPSRRPAGVTSFAELIEFVADRPGHDRRYAIDSGSTAVLGWRPACSFPEALRRTVRWYLDNEGWWRNILSAQYRLERLGK